MNISQQQHDFIQSLDGNLSPEQAAQLLEMGQGDTGATPEPTAQPGAAPAEHDAPAPGDDAGKNGTNDQAPAPAAAPSTAAPEGSSAEPDPATAVIMAKDGKHTISFEKLVEARQAAQDWKARAESAQAALAQLQAQAQQRADAGQAPTQIDNQVAAAQAAIDQGVDPAIFGDFSEADLAKGIQKLVAQQVAAHVEQSVGKVLAPIQAKQAIDANQAHLDAIYAKHPDADSLVESQELATWIDAQPSFVADACRAVLEKGTTQQVIELFDRFKQATGGSQPAPAAAPAPADVKAAAKAAIASAPGAVPNSLSDFPGGRPSALTLHEQMAAMTPTQLLEHMQAGNMTPEQIERYLNTL